MRQLREVTADVAGWLSANRFPFALIGDTRTRTRTRTPIRTRTRTRSQFSINSTAAMRRSPASVLDHFFAGAVGDVPYGKRVGQLLPGLRAKGDFSVG